MRYIAILFVLIIAMGFIGGCTTTNETIEGEGSIDYATMQAPIGQASSVMTSTGHEGQCY